MTMELGGPGTGPRADISVTPLVDVCLVVLLILMVLTPFLAENKGVQLPKAHDPAVQPEGSQSVTLTMDASGRLFLGDRSVTRDDLPRALAAARSESGNKPLRFQADARLSYGDLKEVLSQVRASGYGETAFMVRQADDREQPLSGTPAGPGVQGGGGR